MDTKTKNNGSDAKQPGADSALSASPGSERYVIKHGRWGMYIHDTVIGADVDLYAVANLLNGNVQAGIDSTWRKYIDDLSNALADIAGVPREPTPGTDNTLRIIREKLSQTEARRN